MSTTIEEKVVEMRFDNKNFEKNVGETMSTLDKLKQKLNLTGASKGLENIDTTAKNINFSGLSNAVQTVSAKFSALEVMGVTALANITNSAVNAGKRIASALTIEPIKTGFSEYETQINAVQTILANTESKGTTLTDVNKALDELNTYADKTIYNFTEMTRNIGTFTAAGVDLDTSVSAIQGIANLAAVSGSNSQQASTAMYQLSQALANGKVNLQDWNSVVNAGMGGEVFQNALKRTAKNMGKDVDGMIKKYGSFRESLTKGEWLTSDVLTKTLEQFTMAAEEGSEEWNNFKKSLMADGYSEKQAIEILKMANTATDAATKVKTFTQLWDTLKESAQSGWTQTWEILVGDFEEAKELLTGISNVVSNFIGKSAEARNNLLQGWKDAGGRTNTIEAFKNLFEGIVNIVSPIREAFREIFPPLTVEQLTSFTDKFKNLTARFADFTKKHGPQIKSTFKGIFAVLDIVVTVVGKVVSGIAKVTGSLLGFTGGILTGTASLGDWLSNLRDSIKESNVFGKAIDKVVSLLQNGIGKVKDFGKSIKDSFKSDGYEGFFGFLKGLWEFITKIASAVSNALGGIGKGIANAFGENSFGDVVDSGLFGVLLVGLYRFVDTLRSPLESLSEMFGSFEEGTSNIIGILDDVRGCFQAYQEQLKAGTLLKIAGAIGILAASVFVISTIDAESLGQSLAAITVLFAELAGTMFLLSKITPGIKNTLATIPLMLTMSTAMLILAGALKVIGSLKPEQMVTSLVGLAGGMTILIVAISKMPEKDVNKTAKAIRKLSVALLILSGALKVIGSMSWNELAKGLVGVSVGLIAMVAAINRLPENTTTRSLGMIALATSLVILGSALKKMGSMKWSEIGKSLAALAGSLLVLVAALNLMPPNMIVLGFGLIGVATALAILGKALTNMGAMSWSEIGKGLTVLGGALLELSIALYAIQGSIAGAASLLVAAHALTILCIPLKILGGMSWESIIKSLVTLGGALTIIGIAGAVLTPIIPSILALAGALALLGVSSLAIGAGLALIGVGITLLATSLAAGATAIVASITVIIVGILDLIPTIVSKLGEAIMAFCKVIGDCAPAIVESLLKLLTEVAVALAKYTPVFANALFDFLIGVLDVLAERLPELIASTVKLINAFFLGLVDALKNLDGASLLKGVIAVGIMSALVHVLAGVSGMVGPAMIGLLGVGALITELALILGAIGALSKIPGLAWLIEEGGNFLEKIGTAIGQFIGGLVGGIAQGFTNSLPDIGTDLSSFMKNIQPFINGAKSIDESVLSGVKSLVGAILLITGGNIANSIGSFITGKKSLADFGEQLVPFGKSMQKYGAAVSGVDSNAIMASAHAAKALAVVADNIPNSGGLVSLFTGENNLSDFATQLVPFGTALKSYAQSVAGIDAQAITASASAAKALTSLADTVPNEGGMVAWFTGDNSVSEFGDDLVSLGVGLKNFAIATTGIVPESIIAAANAGKALADMMTIIPNTGGMVAWFTGENSVSRFGSDLVSLGVGLKNFATATTGIIPESIIAAANAAKALAQMMSVIPNEGGMVAWFTGDNSVSKFGNDLVSLGIGLKNFAIATTGIIPENITAAANAAKSLAQMTATIPNEGGMVAWFTGENSVSKFGSELPILGQGLKGFSDAVTGIVPENVTAAANAAKSLAQMTATIPNEGGVQAWFAGENNMTGFAKDLPILGQGLKGFSDAVTGIVPENVTAASNAAKTLAQMTATIPNEGGVQAWFAGESSITKFAGDLPVLGEGLKGFADKVAGIVPENVTAAANAAKSIAQMTATIPNEGGVKAWFTGESSISNFADKLPTLGEGIKGFANKIKGIEPDSVKAAASAAKTLAEMTKTVPKDPENMITFGEKLVTFGAKLKSYFNKTSGITAEAITNSTNAISSIKTSTSSLDSAAISSAADAIDEIVKSIIKISNISESSVSGFTKAMEQLASTNITGVINAFSEAGPKLETASSNAIKQLQAGIESQQINVESACDKLSKAISDCKTSIEGYKAGFYNAGSYLVTGFANGIGQNTYKATAKAKAMAKAAKIAAEQELGINSPSKVFYKIGSFTGAGFINALNDSTSGVFKAGASMADSARKGINSAISKVTDLLNSDVDSQPVIRPILDLSDIQAGANNINSMFGDVSVGNNLNAISHGMNARNQNGVNGDVVSAINKLRKDLGNVNGTTNNYTVNGVTYDDGSNITDAVRTIVRAVKVERRV